jgi:hypothetical protein
MKDIFGNYTNNNGLINLLDFPFDIKNSSSDLDAKWRFYKNILGHYTANKNDSKLSGGIVNASPDSSSLCTEYSLKEVLDTLLYGIVYGSVPKWKANDWLAKHPVEAFKNADQLKSINYKDYNIIKVPPYESGQYKGHNPKYDIYSEDQYLFIGRGRDIPSINLVEAIPISFNHDKYNHGIVYWRGYIQNINLSSFKNNNVFFTSKSNLIAGSNIDSFTEQTILADLLEEC